MEERKKDSFELLVKRLYDASLKGDVPSLLNLLQEDPLILDRCIIEKSGRFPQSPLQVSVNFGHLEFTTEILRRNPRLAEELDQAQRWSPLHVSSANGDVEIVKALLAVNPSMCLARDLDGCNPIHVAAMRGRVDVLGELVRAKPQAAREQTHRGETSLHLCVKHDQLEALELLVNEMGDVELLNYKDNNGNTVLHLAVTTKQPEMVKFLLKDKRIKKNMINTNGLTSMDICLQTPRKDSLNMQIWRSLKTAKALRAKVVLRPRNQHKTWLESQRNALMIVASLIATIAFQVGVNPPGGFWQDDNDSHIAGLSVMASKDRVTYDSILIYSTIVLVSSLSVILLLISGLPCQRLFVVILMITMWVAVSGTTITYVQSVRFLSQDYNQQKGIVWYVLNISLIVWFLLMLLLVIGHILRILVRLIKILARFVVRLCRCCGPRTVTRSSIV